MFTVVLIRLNWFINKPYLDHGFENLILASETTANDANKGNLQWKLNIHRISDAKGSLDEAV